MDRGDTPLITEGSRSGLDMDNQLWRRFITSLGEVYLVARPEGCSFLPIACVEVIRRGDELSCGQGRFSSPLPTLIERLKLLFPDGTKCGDGRQRFHPVWGSRSLERIK